MEPSEEGRYQELMAAHHYLGALPKIGNTIWYLAQWHGQWLSLLGFSASALKCGVRDRWIGWRYRHQYDRLSLVANNSRFLILPGCHQANLGSKVLSLVRRRIQADWQRRFGFPLLLLETFVDPSRYHGTIYRAANWQLLGHSRGYQRIRGGYTNVPGVGKLVFVEPLQRNACALLRGPQLDRCYQSGAVRMRMTADQMRALPDFFTEIDDPRRRAGRRHPLTAVLAIATAAVLCGMRGYQEIGQWATALGQNARARLRCCYRHGEYHVPSLSQIRRVLISVDPDQLDQALQRWNMQFGSVDESLAIDGKTMCNAIDDAGRRTHVMSVVGHDSKQCYTQKKWGS